MIDRWIETSDWLPRTRSYQDILNRYQSFVIENRTVWVADGNPLKGYISLNDDDGHVLALYSDPKRHGTGKALLDHAKSDRDYLQLWTFAANVDGRRFYEREGFVEVERTAGDNEENLPDIRYEWRRPQ